MDLEKEIICTEVPNLRREDRICILSIIHQYQTNQRPTRELIQTFRDGSRVDLDDLPDSLIADIYSKLQYFLEM